jgi:hypothetical protein
LRNLREISTVQITLDIPDHLGEQLKQFGDRLPELLERGLQEFVNDQKPGNFLGDQEIISVLASQPTPEQLLAIRPSPELQDRMSYLLSQNKAGLLSSAEETELDRYMTLEHLVRLAKAQAMDLADLELKESIKAIQEGFDDFEAGRSQSFQSFVKEQRTRHGLSIDLD